MITDLRNSGESKRSFARALGITSPSLLDLEDREAEGRVTLATLRRHAETLGYSLDLEVSLVPTTERAIDRLVAAAVESPDPHHAVHRMTHLEVARRLIVDPPEDWSVRASVRLPGIKAKSRNADLWIEKWYAALDGGLVPTLRWCTEWTPAGDDMRQMSPLSGYLTDEERLAAIALARGRR